MTIADGAKVSGLLCSGPRGAEEQTALVFVEKCGDDNVFLLPLCFRKHPSAPEEASTSSGEPQTGPKGGDRTHEGGVLGRGERGEKTNPPLLPRVGTTEEETRTNKREEAEFRVHFLTDRRESNEENEGFFLAELYTTEYRRSL